MRAHEIELIRVLQMAHRYRLTAGPLVMALAAETKRGPGRAFESLAGLLVQGISVVDAVEQSPKALDPLVATQLRVASQTGTLGDVYDEIVDQNELADDVGRTSRRSLLGQLIYTGLAFFVTFFMLAFLMTFIVPTLKGMFEEFGIEFPNSMAALISLSRYGGFFFLVGLLVLLGLIGWETQFLGFKRGRLAGRHDHGHLLRLLATVCKSGRPINAGLATLARYYPVIPIRLKLQTVNDELKDNDDPWSLLQQNQLLFASEADALRLAPTPATQGWILEQASQDRRNRFRLSSDRWASAISFTLLMSLAAVVGLAAIAMFSMLYGFVGALS